MKQMMTEQTVTKTGETKMWTASNNNSIWTIKKTEEIKESIECLIEKKAEKQIKALCEQYKDLEWLAGLIGYEDQEGIRITEIILFEQEVSGAYVELTNKGSEDMAKTKTIGWIHSHNKMGVFFSGTDIKTSSFNQVSLVVNNKFEIIGRTIIKTIWDKKVFVPLGIFTEKEEKEEEPIIKEAKSLIKEKTIPTTITFDERKDKNNHKITEYEYKTISYKEEDVDEKYKQGRRIICEICDRPINPKKLIVHEGIPFHETCLDRLEEEGKKCERCGKRTEKCECENKINLWTEDEMYGLRW